MFVKSMKKGAFVSILSVMTVAGATAAVSYAAEEAPEIPVTVLLSGVQSSDGPLYISVQNRDQYQGIKGYGEIIKRVTAGDMSAVVKIQKSGEYAVSVWHDLNDDGVFSMTQDYKILDGWGGSGTIPKGRAPKFDDVRVTIGGGGASIPVALIYPSK